MTGLLNRLERTFGRFAIPHLTLYIIIGQAFVFLYGMINPEVYQMVPLVPALVKRGQVWRIFTFAFEPGGGSWLFIAFVLYFLYFMGTTLENHWGTFRYNLFLLSGWFLTVAVAFVTPGYVAENKFIGGAIFLAFAYLYPDFVIYIFFILPVKVRWVAILTWIWYAYEAVTGDWGIRLGIVAAVGNYLIFFGSDIMQDIRLGRRRMKTQVDRAAKEAGLQEARHRCRVCGKDSNQYPLMDFRYCSQCEGDACYCEEHIRNHVHVVAGGNQ